MFSDKVHEPKGVFHMDVWLQISEKTKNWNFQDNEIESKRHRQPRKSTLMMKLLEIPLSTFYGHGPESCAFFWAKPSSRFNVYLPEEGLLKESRTKNKIGWMAALSWSRTNLKRTHLKSLQKSSSSNYSKPCTENKTQKTAAKRTKGVCRGKVTSFTLRGTVWGVTEMQIINRNQIKKMRERGRYLLCSSVFSHKSHTSVTWGEIKCRKKSRTEELKEEKGALRSKYLCTILGNHYPRSLFKVSWLQKSTCSQLDFSGLNKILLERSVEVRSLFASLEMVLMSWLTPMKNYKV